MVRAAGEACRAVLRHDPGHVEALRLLANLAYRSGRMVEATDLLTRATQVAPDNAVVHSELGLVQFGLKRPAQALHALRRALAIDPTMAQAHNTLGMALQETGCAAEAEAAFRKAVELNPQFAGAHDNLADSLRRGGRLQEARDCLESALRLVPDSTSTRVSLGEVLIEQGEHEAGVAHYRQALAATTNTAPLHVRLGIALKEMGDRVGALAALQQAVSADPSAPQAHYHLAHALLAFGRIEDAIGSVQAALRLRADFSAGHTLYATALAAQGHLEAGLAQMRKVLAPGTARSECLAVLAARLLDTGHTEQALVCLRLKLHADPHDALAQHYVAALSGANPERASDEYVRSVFDGCADVFNRTLQDVLGYSLPRELAHALLAARTPATPWDVLDLGCGTGLVGGELAPHARSLVGIDLSTRMLERARESGKYTSLRCADLTAALPEEPLAGYDIVTAADVFIYVGKLDAVVPAVRRALRPGGMFAFSTEAAEHGSGATAALALAGYQLRATGRYAHRADYLRELATSNGFRIERLSELRLRFENRHPVMGWLNLWAAP